MKDKELGSSPTVLLDDPAKTGAPDPRAPASVGGTIVMDLTEHGVEPRTVEPPIGQGELVTGSLFAGRYLIEGLLGRGGMGVVYRAKDRLVDERVALKLLDVGSQLAPDAVDLFRREVRIARRVSHPNVVRIHDLSEHGERLFITMEFVEGSDVRREMTRHGGRLAPARAARIALEVAQGLKAAHAMGVVHRDLKPENVLVDASGRSVLSDFGIARVFDTTAQAEARKATRIIGTPAYMAPEQVAGQEVGPPCNLYALGTMLFEMLAGRAPFEGDNPIMVAVARLHQLAPDLRTVVDAPEHLALLVGDCLERQPEKRPASADVVIADLESFLASSAGADAGATQRPVTLSMQRKATTQRALRGSRALALPFGAARASLACLPFTFRGPTEHEYLGEALSGELIDVLSRTKGLRVLSSGAVANTTERDPRKLTEQLDVDYVVDGTVQVAGPKLRISVRLVDATGAQLFSERFDLGFEDVFEVQDEAGRRIAEALRLELVTRSSDVELPEEAMQLFLQARRVLRAQLFMEAPKAVAWLERVLELSPEFVPARASLALATLMMWFYPQGDTSRNWEQAADEAVAQALATAGDMVETHIAAARAASHRGRLREAVVALRKAIDIAPTSPEAQAIIGMLECETGRADEGLARLALAHKLEPNGIHPYEAARLAALHGDHAAFDRSMILVKRLTPALARLHLELRHAGWWRDRARIDAVRAEAPSLGPPFAPIFEQVALSYLGDRPATAGAAALAAVMTHVNVRFASMLRQILVELHAAAGDADSAMRWLTEAQRHVLYDVPWLELCPLLVPLRGRPDFSSLVQDVRGRSTAVWAP